MVNIFRTPQLSRVLVLPFPAHIDLDFYTPDINAVFGCSKTSRCNSRCLVALRIGFGSYANAPVRSLSCRKNFRQQHYLNIRLFDSYCQQGPEHLVTYGTLG
jgi:hypothetical protein